MSALASNYCPLCLQLKAEVEVEVVMVVGGSVGGVGGRQEVGGSGGEVVDSEEGEEGQTDSGEK